MHDVFYDNWLPNRLHSAVWLCRKCWNYICKFISRFHRIFRSANSREATEILMFLRVAFSFLHLLPYLYIYFFICLFIFIFIYLFIYLFYVFIFFIYFVIYIFKQETLCVVTITMTPPNLPLENFIFFQRPLNEERLNRKCFIKYRLTRLSIQLIKIVWKKITTFFKRRISIILWSFSS